MKNQMLILAHFLDVDTLMLNCCTDSATETEVERPFGTKKQVSSTTITRRVYFIKRVQPCKS